MHNDSQASVRRHPEKRNHPNFTENAFISTETGENSFTLHPHPALGKNKEVIDYPSDADIRTTRNLKKANLCIILTPLRQVVCYNRKDGFRKKSCVFKY